MELKFIVPTVAVMLIMLMALARVFLGPTVFDRVLAGNMFATKTILLIAVAGFFSGRPEWLDLALVYALMNFIGIYAILRYAKFESLSNDTKQRGQ